MTDAPVIMSCLAGPSKGNCAHPDSIARSATSLQALVRNITPPPPIKSEILRLPKNRLLPARARYFKHRR